MYRTPYIIHVFKLLLCLILINVGVVLCQTKNGEEFSMLYKNYLRNLLSIVDDDVNPCDDYFQHACGYYQKYIANDDAPLPPDDNEIQANYKIGVPPQLYNLENRMHFFEEQHQNFVSATGVLIRDLYMECKALRNFEGSRTEQEKQLEKLEFIHWKRILMQIPFLAEDYPIYSNWPFLHFEWKQYETKANLSWAHLAAQFAAHGISTFLHIFFAQHTIYTVPPEHARCGDIESMRATLRPLLQQRNIQIADIIGNEILVFCRELTGELPLDETIEEAAEYNSTEEILLDEKNVEYFETYFSLLNITYDEVTAARKLSMDVPKLRFIIAQFRRTEPRIVFNYIMWRGYEALRHITNDCYLLTDEFEELLLAEYWQWNVFQPYFNRKVALATYLFHTTRFQQIRKTVLMGENWDAFLDKKPERKDFNLPRLLKNYANAELESNKLMQPYASLMWQNNTFYRNLLEIRRLRLRGDFTIKTKIQDADDDVNSAAYFLRQFLYFTILIVKEPLFHYYATQGRELWERSQLLRNTDGFYTAMDCLEHQNSIYINDNADEISIYRFLEEQEVLEIFNFYRAFIATYRDYQFWLAGEFFAFAEDFVLETFGLASHRILFYAVAQQFCGRNDMMYSSLINRSFMNMHEFQETFNCTLEAPMNPTVKCLASSCDNLN